MATEFTSLVDYVDGVLQELQQHAPLALGEGEASAVHRARVATRRFGAAMDVVGPLTKDKQRKTVYGTLRKLRKSVQDLRDLDVMQGHLDELGREDCHAAAAARVKQALATERDELCHEVISHAKRKRWLKRLEVWSDIRESLLVREQQVRGRLLQCLLEQHERFASQAQSLSSALLAEPPQMHDIEPHALRIAGKSLRYVLEMVQAEHFDVSDVTLRAFKQLQDALGFWHDYHVLAQRILACAAGELKEGAYRLDEPDLVELGAAAVRKSDGKLKDFAQLWINNGPRIADEITRIAADEAGSGDGGTPVQEARTEVEAHTI